jgi:preprotein translocase subunit YajC
MVKSLRKGDRVVTIGGLHGEVAEVKEMTIILKTVDKSKFAVDHTAIKRKLKGD